MSYELKNSYDLQREVREMAGIEPSLFEKVVIALAKILIIGFIAFWIGYFTGHVAGYADCANQMRREVIH